MYQTALIMHKIIWRIHLIKIIKIIKIMEMIMPVCKKMNLNSEEILQDSFQDRSLQGLLMNKKDFRLSCKSYLHLSRESKLKMLMMVRRKVMDLFHKV